MNCTACGTPGTAVTKTMDSGNEVRRRRLCACGYQETTRERPEKGTGSFMAINDQRQGTLVARGEGGDIDLSSGSSPSLSASERAGACSEARAKNPYSEAFEACWKAYGRREEKVKAYARWKIEAVAAGGEDVLRDMVLKALAWQGPQWERDGWRFAKYFERYLKARKWEDEPMPDAAGAKRAPARGDGTVSNMRDWLARNGGK